MDMDLPDQLVVFQKSVEYTGADGLLIPAGKKLTVYQLVLHYGKYAAYSAGVWHQLEDCPVSEAVVSSAAQSAGIGSSLSSRQLGIWIAIGIIGIILAVVMVFLVWRHRQKICCLRSRNSFEMSMDPLNAASTLALDSSQRSSYIPDRDGSRKNSVSSSDQPPSYHTFMAGREKTY